MTTNQLAEAPVATAMSGKCCGNNPIVQTIYTADPHPMVHNDTLYVYTGHDDDGAKYFVMNDWRCFSTKDMVNWTHHGSPLSWRTFAWARGDAWAGQCIERDGKFYWYVPVGKTGGGMVLGVAVSDSPTGPFKDPIGHPLVEAGGGDIDPTAFIDDDGQAYLYWGNPYLKYVKLNRDMISYDQTVGVVDVPLTEAGFGKRVGNKDRATLYEEGPWFYKRNGIYYMVYAASGIPENICYSTSSSPTGPWTFRGIIMPTEGGSFTNHPGVIDYKGRSYFFYHNGALPGGGGFARSVCVEEFTYNADGSFPTLNMTQGPESIEHLNPYLRTEAATIAWESGIKTAPRDTAGVYVTDIDNGDYIQVKGVDFGTAGAATFTASVASGVAGGTIELHLDNVDGPQIGYVPVPYTGGWQEWKSVTASVSGATGIHDLFLVFKANAAPAGHLFNFDHWQFGRKRSAHDLVAIAARVDPHKIDTADGRNIGHLKVLAIYSDGTSSDVTAQAEVRAATEGAVKVRGGVVTGLALGPVSLNARYGGKCDQVRMLVRDLKAEGTVKQVKIEPDDGKMLTAAKRPFTVTAEYLDGHTEDVTASATYANAHPEVVTLDKGLITARQAGKTTLSVSFKGPFGEAATCRLDLAVCDRDPYVENRASDFAERSGGSVENCSEGSKDIGCIGDGNWVKFADVDFGSGAASFEVRVASGGNGGSIEIVLDSLTGPVIGDCRVEATGGWQTWATRTCPVAGAQGKHDVYLRFSGKPGYLFNVSWWRAVK